MQTKDQKPKIYGDPGAFKGVYLASIVPEPVAPAPERGPSVMQKEAQAWAAAQRAHSVAGYSAYLTEYPNSSYASAARVARAGLVPAPQAVAQPLSASPSRPIATQRENALSTSTKHDNKETPCSPSLVSEFSCNQCFDAGYLYENQSMSLSERLRNSGSLEANYFEKDLTLPTIANFGAGIVSFSTPHFKISDAMKANEVFDDGRGNKYFLLNPGNSTSWIESIPKYDLGFASINKNLVNQANRDLIRDKNFTVVYKSHPRYWDPIKKRYRSLTSETHVSCQSIGAHFCGDGLVEPNIEVCDDGAENGSLGKCNSTCTAVIKK